jgi:hypothetical protein
MAKAKLDTSRAKTPAKVRCTCKHEYQDRVYGQGIRVANPVENVNKNYGRYRCTVCSKAHP